MKWRHLFFIKIIWYIDIWYKKIGISDNINDINVRSKFKENCINKIDEIALLTDKYNSYYNKGKVRCDIDNIEVNSIMYLHLTRSASLDPKWIIFWIVLSLKFINKLADS